jgi:hypothetical protein
MDRKEIWYESDVDILVCANPVKEWIERGWGFLDFPLDDDDEDQC